MPSWMITVLCALKDSVNPCAVTTMMAFLLFIFELRRRRIPEKKYAVLFIVIMFASLLNSSAGGLMPILYSETFYRSALMFYAGASVVLVTLGLIHLRDWARMRASRGGIVFPVGDIYRDPARRMSVSLILFTIGISMTLTFMSTVWPTDTYVTFQALFISIPGRELETINTLLVYNVIMICPIVLLTFILASSSFSVLVHKRPSLIKIIISSLTLSLGVGLIFIFH